MTAQDIIFFVFLYFCIQCDWNSFFYHLVFILFSLNMLHLLSRNKFSPWQNGNLL